MEEIGLKGIVALMMLLMICILANTMQNSSVMWSVIVIPVVVGMLGELYEEEEKE